MKKYTKIFINWTLITGEMEELEFRYREEVYRLDGNKYVFVSVIQGNNGRPCLRSAFSVDSVRNLETRGRS